MPKLSLTPTPAQNVAVQIRIAIFNLKPNILRDLSVVEKALLEGVNDGSSGDIFPADIVEALGEKDYELVKTTIQEFKDFLG